MSDKMTYEEAITKLENIVKQLEDGSLPLDKSLELFEEGARLTTFCTKALNDAELKVKTLWEDNEKES